MCYNYFLKAGAFKRDKKGIYHIDFAKEKKEIELKGIVWEDMVNYKKICTTLMFPKCNWKCDIENGVQLCQNKGLAVTPSQWYDIDTIMDKYKNNDLIINTLATCLS